MKWIARILHHINIAAKYYSIILVEHHVKIKSNMNEVHLLLRRNEELHLRCHFEVCPMQDLADHLPPHMYPDICMQASMHTQAGTAENISMNRRCGHNVAAVYTYTQAQDKPIYNVSSIAFAAFTLLEPPMSMLLRSIKNCPKWTTLAASGRDA